MKYKHKAEPLPGNKVEKRKKRRWDRVWIISDWKYGDFLITNYEFPHVTFREKKVRHVNEIKARKSKAKDRRLARDKNYVNRGSRSSFRG